MQGLIRDKVHAGEDMISALGLLLKHDNLFNLYPDFKDMPVVFETGERMGGTAAGYAPPSALPESIIKQLPGAKSGLMQVNTDYMLETDREELISSLLHEAQHGIQDFEGLSAGASSAWSPDQYLSKHLDYTGEAGPKADRMYMMNENAAEQGDEVQDALSRFYYKLNAGEAEARAVELRRRMKAGERADLPAWLYYTDWYDEPIGSRSLFDYIESK